MRPSPLLLSTALLVAAACAAPRVVPRDAARPVGTEAEAKPPPLAVVSDAPGPEVLDEPTASTRPRLAATPGWFERLYQAPDGALMATMIPGPDEQRHAVRVEPGGGASVVDLPPGGRDPGWSPDGSRLVVRTAAMPNAMSTSWRLFVDDPATKEHAFVEHGYGGVLAEWSSRAHRLLVVHGTTLLYDADSHQVWKVPVSWPIAAALDANGGRAALEAQEGLLVVALASKEPPAVLRPRINPPQVLLALSGGRLAAVTHEGEVTVWDVQARAVVASWSAGFEPEHVAWLGEAKRLALSRKEVLRLSDPDGSRAVTVTALQSP